jgi:hypothetical protein
MLPPPIALLAILCFCKMAIACLAWVRRCSVEGGWKNLVLQLFCVLLLLYIPITGRSDLCLLYYIHIYHGYHACPHTVCYNRHAWTVQMWPVPWELQTLTDKTCMPAFLHTSPLYLSLWLPANTCLYALENILATFHLETKHVEALIRPFWAVQACLCVLCLPCVGTVPSAAFLMPTTACSGLLPTHACVPPFCDLQTEPAVVPLQILKDSSVCLYAFTLYLHATEQFLLCMCLYTPVVPSPVEWLLL